MMLLPRESSYVRSPSYSLCCSSRAVSSAKSPSGCQSHQALGLPVGSVTVAMGRKAEGVRKRPDAESLQIALGRLYRIWAGVGELHHGNQTNASVFLNAPNPQLENKTSREFIQSGELAVVKSFTTAMKLRPPAHCALSISSFSAFVRRCTEEQWAPSPAE
jgi:hypothetical protein